MDLQENVPLAHYTSARVGGPAKALLHAHSADELASIVTKLWEHHIPFQVLGAGSNVLIGDRGISQLVILNRAHNTRIDIHHQPLSVWAESGTNLSALSRQLALRGLSGLEWAAAIPGTVGGAVYGNAGAFGSDVASSLAVAEILHPQSGRGWWTSAQMGYQYRSSTLKREQNSAVILSARFRLEASTSQLVREKLDAYQNQRRGTQPPGASLGSMFKNPVGDYAGRLIEAAGLKGYHSGHAEISSVHANFFIVQDGAKAQDVWNLIEVARQKVLEKFGIHLELEIERIGDWDQQ
jgi:UDP-N-acetylmuramate dehydrogenase